MDKRNSPRQVFICQALRASNINYEHIKRPQPVSHFQLPNKLWIISIRLGHTFVKIHHSKKSMFKFELHLHHLHLQMKHWLFDREKKYFGEILWKSSDRLLSFKKAWKCFWGRRMPCIRLLGIREKIQIALDLFRVGWTYVRLPFAMIRALDRVIRVRNIWNLFKATLQGILTF